MCATPDKAATEEFRRTKGRQRAYKVVQRRTAAPLHFHEYHPPYRPGLNEDCYKTRTYLGYSRTYRGLHCYVRRQQAVEVNKSNRRHRALVCITYDPADVIVAEATRVKWGRYRQVVVRAFHISKHAWKQAGLPVNGKGGRS